MAKKEAAARIKIDKQLEEAGWRFFDDEKGKASVQLETGTKITREQLDDLGNDYENVSQGYLDYLLIGADGFPVAVLEAKREGDSAKLLSAKRQAREYAKSVHAPFVILSNGNIHYLWEVENGNPEIITKFPTQQSLNEIKDYRVKPESLSSVEVKSDYIAISQKPNYQSDPSWHANNLEKLEFISRNKLRFLRPYQLNAIKAIQLAATKGKTRYLLEMATGTGKTLTTAAIIKLFMKSGNAKRVLFLVDRIELEDQAQKAFTEYLKNDYTSVIFKNNKDDWRKAEIVVSTVQTLQNNNRYREIFSPTDFELVISDEAHRSINGNARAVFEYFVGYKLGLTATPKDYLKRFKTDDNENTQRAFERRQLLDTYKTFGCESGEPTFRYSLVDGVKDSYLVNPIVLDARTDITTELLSEAGYSVHIRDEEGEEKEEVYFARQFEKKFFNDKTNVEFCKTFLKNALTDPITGEIGKSLIFCVSQTHAAKITDILNRLAMQLWEGKYNSDFAEQVTSLVSDSRSMTTQFANNNLNGRTKWLDAYKSSKTRVCVTVGMMTTGYDCTDLLNIVLMRPIFSPSDFVQMKGRGTRTYTFTFEDKSVDKTHFKLFDFFGNCEYFEEKFDYDEVIQLPPDVTTKTGGEPPLPKIEELLKLDEDDPLKSLKTNAVSDQGMRIDREIFGQALKEDIQSKIELKNAYEQQDYHTAEEIMRTEVINKPKHHLTLDKVKEVLNLDRRVTVRELLDLAFDPSYKPKSKDELLNEEFDKFLITEKIDPEQYDVAKTLFKSYASSPTIEKYVDNGDYTMLEFSGLFSPSELQDLDEVILSKVPSYVKDYVSTGRYR